MLLSLINRPSFTGSACTVPVKKLLIEGGLGYQSLNTGGEDIDGANLSFRSGLNNNTEFLIFSPDYVKQSTYPTSGFTPVWLGVKSRFFYTKDSIFSVALSISPPSGSNAFGSPHTEAVLTPIFFDTLNSKISYQLQAGVSALCDPKIYGGNCFRSFNPDFVINYVINKKLNAYLDFYAETKTDYYSGFGLVSGGGFLYLIRPSIVLDVEYYHSIRGGINNIKDFVGLGFAKLFSF